MKFTFKNNERLKSKKIIEKLYKEGKFLKVFPFRMAYIQTEHTSNYSVQAGVSVPKKNFKSAVDRNRIKRLMRESYRKQKYLVYDEIEIPYAFMISYIAKDERKYVYIKSKMKELLTLLVEEIAENKLKVKN